MSAINLTPRCYVWVIAIFLFTSILSGGTFLVLYMTQPETPTTSWYPTIGICLVCLPWFFWVITVLYRILSRTLGFRMVCWGKGVLSAVDSLRNGEASTTAESVGDNGGLEEGTTNNATINNSLQGDNEGSRQVHFGEVVVLGEKHENNQGNDTSYGGSLSSKASHESEVPLKLSMAS